jgi:hypothetical protein
MNAVIYFDGVSKIQQSNKGVTQLTYPTQVLLKLRKAQLQCHNSTASYWVYYRVEIQASTHFPRLMTTLFAGGVPVYTRAGVCAEPWNCETLSAFSQHKLKLS